MHDPTAALRALIATYTILSTALTTPTDSGIYFELTATHPFCVVEYARPTTTTTKGAELVHVWFNTSAPGLRLVVFGPSSTSSSSTSSIIQDEIIESHIGRFAVWTKPDDFPDGGKYEMCVFPAKRKGSRSSDNNNIDDYSARYRTRIFVTSTDEEKRIETHYEAHAKRHGRGSDIRTDGGNGAVSWVSAAWVGAKVEAITTDISAAKEHLADFRLRRDRHYLTAQSNESRTGVMAMVTVLVLFGCVVWQYRFIVSAIRTKKL
eukprot:PhM_4_TR1460/c0_g1_i1/m.59823